MAAILYSPEVVRGTPGSGGQVVYVWRTVDAAQTIDAASSVQLPPNHRIQLYVDTVSGTRDALVVGGRFTLSDVDGSVIRSKLFALVSDVDELGTWYSLSGSRGSVVEEMDWDTWAPEVTTVNVVGALFVNIFAIFTPNTASRPPG